VTAATRLGEGRYALELPLTPPPEQIVAGLMAEGAQLVSLNPLRDTLEDVFLRQVSGEGGRPSTSLGTEEPG
jgi:hypothetical protein